MTILAPCPWSERLLPCRVEGEVVVCVAGPVGKNVPLVVKLGGKEPSGVATRLRQLGYRTVRLESSVPVAECNTAAT